MLVTALVVASLIGTLTLVVPPAMPLDARLRARSPVPPGTSLPAPAGPSFRDPLSADRDRGPRQSSRSAVNALSRVALRAGR